MATYDSYWLRVNWLLGVCTKVVRSVGILHRVLVVFKCIQINLTKYALYQNYTLQFKSVLGWVLGRGEGNSLPTI